MKIAADVLVRQARDALERWPWIGELEDMYALPRWLLLAVGSRETNLSERYTKGATGDGGHGHGVMQYDDRSHKIPAGFDLDARLQFTVAAEMLRSLGQHFKGNWSAALAAYNAGVGAVQRRLDHGEPVDWATTGKDYSVDVLARRDVLDRAIDHQPHPATLPVSAPVVGPPVVVARSVLGGKPVALVIVSIPTDANGDGSAPAPPGFLAVSDAGSHDKYDAATEDKESLVVAVGARQSGGGIRLVVAAGPKNTTVGAPVLVAD